MEKDNLEKFIIENREDFDIYEPANDIWEKINLPGSKKKTTSLYIVLSRYAAVVAITAIITFLAVNNFNKSDKNSNSAIVENPSKTEQPPQSIIIPELAEAEAYYSGLVNSRINEIAILTTNSPEVKKELDFDFKELEQIYEELKTDLADNAGNQEVIEAMIQNYRTRVEILESLLISLKNENKTRENHENNSVSL